MKGNVVEASPGVVCFGMLLSIMALFSSCNNETEIEKKLRENVIEQSKGIVKDYKLISVNIDTITAGERKDSLEKIFDWADVEPDLEVLKEMRNRDFVTFHSYDPEYESKVMHGELRDASEWCTTIREVTEKADSLIAIWPTVRKYNYDYLWLITWYGDRENQYYQRDDSWSMSQLVEDNKAKLIELSKLAEAPNDSIIGYEILHNYTIKNPILNNTEVNIQRKVFVDKNLNITEIELL